MRRIPYGLRNNRFFIPEDILFSHNLTADKLWDRVHGKPKEEIFDAVLDIAAMAKNDFEKSIQIYK